MAFMKPRYPKPACSVPSEGAEPPSRETPEPALPAIADLQGPHARFRLASTVAQALDHRFGSFRGAQPLIKRGFSPANQRALRAPGSTQLLPPVLLQSR